MTMAYVWAAMAVCSVVCGLITGRTGAVSAAALEGAGAAVQLCISLAGILCLWSGFMEILKRTGLEAHLARLLRPVLRRLLPRACRDGETMAAVSFCGRPVCEIGISGRTSSHSLSVSS